MPGESLEYTDDGGVRSDTYVDPANKALKADQIGDVLAEAQAKGLVSPKESVVVSQMMHDGLRSNLDPVEESPDTLTSSH